MTGGGPNIEQGSTGASPPTDAPTHVKLFDRFELQAVLGRGASATVYRAFDHRLGSEVALKVTHPHLAEASVAAPEREIHAGARLNHPHIARIFEHGRCPESGDHYLVIELVEGAPLDEAMNTVPRSRRPALMRAMLMQLLEALDHAHDRGVLHRDIKPSNIILTPDGRFKLVDFSVSKLAGSTLPLSSPGLYGTLGYCAPELLSGAEATVRSDLYALARVAAEYLEPDRSNEPEHRRVNRERAKLLTLIAPLLSSDPSMRPESAASALRLLSEERRTLTRYMPARLIWRSALSTVVAAFLLALSCRVGVIRINVTSFLLGIQEKTGTELILPFGLLVPGEGSA